MLVFFVFFLFRWRDRAWEKEVGPSSECLVVKEATLTKNMMKRIWVDTLVCSVYHSWYWFTLTLSMEDWLPLVRCIFVQNLCIDWLALPQSLYLYSIWISNSKLDPNCNMTLRVAGMIPISNTGHTYMCAHGCAEYRLVQHHWFQDFLGTTPLMRCLATLVGLVIGILTYRGFTSTDFEGGHEGCRSISAWKANRFT